MSHFTCGSVGMDGGCMSGWSVALAGMHRDSRGRPRYQWCRRPNETGSLTKEENDLFHWPRSRMKKSFKQVLFWIQACLNYWLCFSEILTWSTLSAAGRPGSKTPVVALSGASIGKIKFILHSLVWLLADQLRGEGGAQTLNSSYKDWITHFGPKWLNARFLVLGGWICQFFWLSFSS